MLLFYILSLLVGGFDSQAGNNKLTMQDSCTCFINKEQDLYLKTTDSMFIFIDTDLLLGRKYSFKKRGIIKRGLEGDIELIVTSFSDAEKKFTHIDGEDEALNMHGKITKKGIYLDSPYQILLRKSSCKKRVLKNIDKAKGCSG